MRQTMIMMVATNMIASPTAMSVFLPAFSIRTRETRSWGRWRRPWRGWRTGRPPPPARRCWRSGWSRTWPAGGKGKIYYRTNALQGISTWPKNFPTTQSVLIGGDIAPSFPRRKYRRNSARLKRICNNIFKKAHSLKIFCADLCLCACKNHLFANMLSGIWGLGYFRKILCLFGGR